MCSIRLFPSWRCTSMGSIHWRSSMMGSSMVVLDGGISRSLDGTYFSSLSSICELKRAVKRLSRLSLEMTSSLQKAVRSSFRRNIRFFELVKIVGDWMVAAPESGAITSTKDAESGSIGSIVHSSYQDFSIFKTPGSNVCSRLVLATVPTHFPWHFSLFHPILMFTLPDTFVELVNWIADVWAAPKSSCDFGKGAKIEMRVEGLSLVI